MLRRHPVLDQPAHLRASDADRERMADFLKGHCAQGRLTADELWQRLGVVYEARTFGDLGAVARDLPGGRRPAVTRRRADRRPGRVPRIALLAFAAVFLAVTAGHALAWVAVAVLVTAASLVFAVAFAVAPIVAVVAGTAWVVRQLAERLHMPVHRLP